MPIRIILQRIHSAKLLLNGKSFNENKEEKEEWMECGEGVIIYIAFFKDTSDEEISSLISKIFSNPLFRTLKNSIKKHDVEASNVEMRETNIMIVPQFSLGGKMKSGKAGAQYHQNAKPEIAASYYSKFCKGLKEKANTLKQKKQDKNLNTNCHFGVFGNRQGLHIVTHGPFTHCFDINIVKKENNKKDKKDKKVKKGTKDTKDTKDNNNDNHSTMSHKIDSIVALVERL